MLAAGALCAAAFAAPLAAWAAPVRGTVTLPAEMKSGRRHQGYWRVENGNVPVQPTPSRGDTLVVIDGLKGQAPAARTVTVELAGLQANPSAVVLGPGSVVEIRNNDKVPHDLGIVDQPNIMAVERLAPGGLRRQRFGDVGGYAIRCAEYPHIVISVLVVDSPHYAPVDDKGAFKIANVADGKGTLKLWARGKWIHDEPIEVAGKPLDVAVKVSEGGAKDVAE